MESETEKTIQWNTWQQKLSMKIYFFPQTLEYLNARIQTDYEEKKKTEKPSLHYCSTTVLLSSVLLTLRFT